MQSLNDAGEFGDLYLPPECSAGNRIIGAKDHASIQTNVAEVDKLQADLMASLKPTPSAGPFAGWESQMIPFSDWSRPTASFQRISDWRESGTWKIRHK
uniref:Uncharacterized protein n=1 Tax=Prolemur simus TaxID=1328070 RepID=A0A8C9DS52_PROSS